MYILVPQTSHVEDIQRHMHGFQLNVTLGIEHATSRASIVTAFVDVHIKLAGIDRHLTSQICILYFHLVFTPSVDMNINRNVNCDLTGNRWNMKILARR